MRTHAVIVLVDETEATRAAGPVQLQVLQGCDQISVVGTQRQFDALNQGNPYGDAVRYLVPDDGNITRGINMAVNGAERLWLLSSDTVVSSGWGQAVGAALSGQMADWVAVGPTGDRLTGSQHLEVTAEELQAGFARISAQVAATHGLNFTPADALDLAAVAFDLAKVPRTGSGALFDDQIRDPEWALRDVFVRLRNAGKRSVVAAGVYAARLRPEPNPWRTNLAGRLAYYEKHRAETSDHEPKLFATWALQPQTRHQLQLLKASIQSVARVVDGLHLMVFGDPSGFDQGEEVLDKPEHRLIRDAGRDEADHAKLLTRWLGEVLEGRKKELVVVMAPEDADARAAEAVAPKHLRESGATWGLRMLEGELLEEGVTRAYLERLMRHPDPLVTAYNVQICHHWAGLRLVREDKPYGDGGSRTGDQPGTNDCRLFRTNGMRFATDGARVASVRLRNIGLIHREHLRPEAGLEGIRVSEWCDATRIGFHMLTHSGDNLDDVARWLDWTYGLADTQLVLWTEGEDLTSESFLAARDVVSLFPGARMSSHRTDGTDFAAWRNQAIARLQATEDGEPDWGLFFDPDEWLGDPVADLVPFRRCAESHRLLGFTVQARNLRPGGRETMSASIRLHRLHLRMWGLVHESFGRSIQETGTKHPIAKAPVMLHNRGTHDVEGAEAKDRRYVDLVRQQLAEDPHSVAHWVSLGWHYHGDGYADLAQTCFERAAECSTGSEFLGWHELAMVHLRQGKRALAKAVRHLGPEHHSYETAARVLRFLEGAVQDLPARSSAEPDPLPDYPGPKDAEVRD